MAYVPPSQRGNASFKSRADGETIPTLTTANLKDDSPEEKSPTKTEGSPQAIPLA